MWTNAEDNPVKNNANTCHTPAAHKPKASYFFRIDSRRIIVHDYGEHVCLKTRSMKRLCLAAFPEYFSSFWFRLQFLYDAVHHDNHNRRGCLHIDLQRRMQPPIDAHNFSKHPFLALELCDDGEVKSTPLMHP